MTKLEIYKKWETENSHPCELMLEFEALDEKYIGIKKSELTDYDYHRLMNFKISEGMYIPE